jgi:DNA-binding LacI/PurR family transcriptional regulator
MDAFVQAGLELPGDMSVVGIDNSQICDFLRPSLTSVRHPLDEMGDLAIHRLMEKLSSNSAMRPNPITILQPELVVRNSTTGVK